MAVVKLMEGMGGVLVVPVPSASPLLSAPLWGVERRWHRARCTGFFDMYSLVTMTSDTAHENKNRSLETGDVVHA